LIGEGRLIANAEVVRDRLSALRVFLSPSETRVLEEELLQPQPERLSAERAEYFRRQAEICVRLSLIASDDQVSKRLANMAREYKALATEPSGGASESSANVHVSSLPEGSQRGH
jgi:hypothetical protein